MLMFSQPMAERFAITAVVCDDTVFAKAVICMVVSKTVNTVLLTVGAEFVGIQIIAWVWEEW